MKLAGVILSAGASQRMGRAKALLDYKGETFLDRLIALLAAHCDPVVVVTAPAPDAIRASITRAGQVVWAVNPHPQRGQLSSLQCGLEAIRAAVDGVLFMPVDHPAVRPETVARLVEEFAGRRERGQLPELVQPRYQGKRGHPVLVGTQVAAELAREPAGSAARDVLHRHHHGAVFLDVDDPGILMDIDDRNDYQRFVERGELP